MYSNTDGPRGYQTKWNKTEKDKYHDIAYIWNLKNDTNEIIYKTETGLQTQEKKNNKQLMVTKGERWGRDKLRVWD